MTNPSFDNGIPELTEVIESDAAAELFTPSVVAEIIPKTNNLYVAPTPSAQKLNTEAAQASAAADWPDEKWRRLETDIRDRIAQQVLARIDSMLEQRVRDALADVLQVAVEALSNEIRHGLSVTLEDVISRAVAQEIASLRTTKI